MINDTEIKKELTVLEYSVLKELIDLLYAEPGFSDVGVTDIAEKSGLTVSQVKGVVGSLVKKGIVCVGEEDFEGIIYLDTKYFYLHPEWCDE